MSELSPDARRLLRQLDAGEATAADEARVRAALERSLGVTLAAAAVVATAPAAASAVATAQAGAAVTAQSAGAVGAGAATGASTSLVTVAVAGVLAVALGGGATAAVIAATRGPGVPDQRVAIVAPVAGAPREAPLPRRVEAEPAVAPAPEQQVDDVAFGVDLRAEPVAGSSPSDPSEHQSPPALQRPAVQRAKLRPPAAAPLDSTLPEPTMAPEVAQVPEAEVAEPALASPHVPSACDRTTELTYLDGAEAALSASQAELALAWLDAFYGACPTGVWDRRAWVTRTSALCASGQFAKATALIGWYVAEYPMGTDIKLIAGSCPASLLPSSR